MTSRWRTSDGPLFTVYHNCPLSTSGELHPTKQPRGQELTLAQHGANQALHYRRLWIEHVNRSVQRCRMVKDRIRLWEQGIRALVMAICGVLHHFRVRLAPWQPMVLRL